jgi:hypothetical protein
MTPNPCTNLNHRRSESPVRFCPQCGVVVNAHIAERQCSEVNHARSRRSHSPFCVDCGDTLRLHPQGAAHRG